MNTLLTFEQQRQLVKNKLAVEKQDGIFSTFKYHRRVMYDYLWDKHPELLECRGHVYNNQNGALVQAAPRKSFNYLENDHWSDVSLDQEVVMFKNINGFMACVTKYRGELVVSTTGSTTSEYAKWAKDLISNYPDFTFKLDNHITDLFEVVVPQDPHIVSEVLGLHHLGYRHKSTGIFIPIGNFNQVKLSTALEIAESDKGEGFMIYKIQNDNIDSSSCCKLKTPYYTGKKKLMRMSFNAVVTMYTKPTYTASNLPEIWRHAPDAILKNFSEAEWIATPEQTRRKFLESIEK